MTIPLDSSVPDTCCKEGASAVSNKSGVVDFPGMQLRPGVSKESFTLVGSVRNKSTQQTITEVKLRLTMEDVLTTGATTTVGEVFLLLQNEVAPGQSQSFSKDVSFNKLPSPKGRHEWNYSITGIKVKE